VYLIPKTPTHPSPKELKTKRYGNRRESLTDSPAIDRKERIYFKGIGEMNEIAKISRTPILTAGNGYLSNDKSGNRHAWDMEVHRATESMRDSLVIKVDSFT
jgi:hypothetical protein